MPVLRLASFHMLALEKEKEVPLACRSDRLMVKGKPQKFSFSSTSREKESVELLIVSEEEKKQIRKLNSLVRQCLLHC